VEHVPNPGHPERPERLAAAVAGAAVEGSVSLVVDADRARVERAIARVHDPRLVDRLRSAAANAPRLFDCGDCPVSSGSAAAAEAAVASVLAAADALATGVTRVTWSPVRPPGHHALRDRAMGFCFFNNVAIAAEELLARGVGPLAIVDFDVHHGNGTQDHFWRHGDVFYFSVHQYPFYPGSGGADEIGEAAGRGTTRNMPLAAGSGDAVFEDAIAVGLDEILGTMKPLCWLVSAGFDAHNLDPLGGLRVTEAGFAAAGRLLRQASQGSPILAVLEGGYEPEALRRSVRSFLEEVTRIGTP
jgi:acetoin utilization deacetylase AcuC-like enzyme